MKQLLPILSILLFSLNINASDGFHKVTFNFSVADSLRESFKSEGRLIIFFTTHPDGEPRHRMSPTRKNTIFAKNFSDFQHDGFLEINNSDGWISTAAWTFENIPEGVYYFQALWDQDLEKVQNHEAGNYYSAKEKVVVTASTHLEVVFNRIIPPSKLIDHDLVKLVDLKSDTLSKWWGKAMYLKASVLLPSNYGKDAEAAYPIRYSIAGFGGSYLRVNSLIQNDKFRNWWLSDKSPNIISVFLNGDGPYGDSYQMDSDNSGPFGYALIHELIPYIESLYRGTNTSETRFVDGCSTGGWVSLGLQLYYPETFNGCFSYSPDALEFENYQLIDIYHDKNAYVNEYGFLRPVRRNTDGEPTWSMKDLVQVENVLSPTNNYLKSGGQFGAHTALYSPKGSNGLPMPMFDPITGAIDTLVAKSWEKYDFKKYVAKNWEVLGPKVQGKIYISMGDMDNFYLNIATRSFADFLKKTKNPKSNAVIEFFPREGHCMQYSNRKILNQIAMKLQIAK